MAASLDDSAFSHGATVRCPVIELCNVLLIPSLRPFSCPQRSFAPDLYIVCSCHERDNKWKSCPIQCSLSAGVSDPSGRTALDINIFCHLARRTNIKLFPKFLVRSRERQTPLITAARPVASRGSVANRSEVRRYEQIQGVKCLRNIIADIGSAIHQLSKMRTIEFHLL